jgi:hypothetical protein
MNVIVALCEIAAGLSYLVFGAITLHEMRSERADRGPSHFGLAFAFMTFTCGPHHIDHGFHLLDGGRFTWAGAFAIAAAVPPGIVFLRLRLEVLSGGSGDRFYLGATRRIALAGPCAAAVAAIVLAVAVDTRSAHLNPLDILIAIVLAAIYGIIGLKVLYTQAVHRRVFGGWSLAGGAFAAIMITCALTHMCHALAAKPDIHSRIIDALGLPAAAYQLWTIERLRRHAIRDWKRPNVVGRAMQPRRPSPWLGHLPG